jgi:hypothetical protein
MVSSSASLATKTNCPKLRRQDGSPTWPKPSKNNKKKEIALGRVVGPFKTRPFKNRHLLSIVTVFKSDGSPRFCLDFSQAGINVLCDKIYIGPQPFEEAVLAMIIAGPTAWGAEWDIENAYRCIDLNPEDADLTQFEIPLLGFAYQAAGIFGAATSGYRWQVAGGRLLSTLYHVMSFRCRPSQDASFVTASSPSAIGRPSNADILNDPSNFTSFGVWDNQELMISRHGANLLQGMSPVTDLSTSRCTDDFLHCAPSFARVKAASLVIAFLHRRYKFVLKAAKCILTRVPKFEGFLFDLARQLLEVPFEKLCKAISQLSTLIRAIKVSIFAVDSNKGLLGWFSKIFTLLRPFLRSSSSWVTKHRNLADTKKIKETSPVFSLSKDLRNDLITVLNFLKSGIRSRSIFLRSIPNIQNSIQVVIHLDWAGSPSHCQAGVIITSGEWFVHQPSQKQVSFLAPPGGSMNSPGFEGATFPVALSTFREQVAGRIVLVCMDNLPFIQAYYNMKSDSPAVAEAVKIVAMAQLYLNCFIILDHVRSNANLSDDASRNRLSTFRKNCLAKRIPLHEKPLNARLPDSSWLSPSSLLF